MNTLVQPRDVLKVFIGGKPGFFARVDAITGDVKPGWLHLHMLVLSEPLQELTWILEPKQIDGEVFTMGGTEIRIERLPDPPEDEALDKGKDADGKVISFPGRKSE